MLEESFKLYQHVCVCVCDIINLTFVTPVCNCALINVWEVKSIVPVFFFSFLHLPSLFLSLASLADGELKFAGSCLGADGFCWGGGEGRYGAN